MSKSKLSKPKLQTYAILNKYNLIRNEGYKELIETIQAVLNSMDSDIRTYYLTEVYDDYLVYKRECRESGEKLFKTDYKVNTDNSVEFVGEPVEVRKEVKFTVMQSKEDGILIPPGQIPGSRQSFYPAPRLPKEDKTVSPMLPIIEKPKVKEVEEKK